MIKSFRDQDTKRLFNEERVRRWTAIETVALRKLVMLNAARRIADLKIPPKNRLEKLKGDRLGQYAIRVNDKYRICFIFREGDAYDVELVDYH